MTRIAFVIFACVLINCKSIQRGGEQKAQEINKDLSQVMALLSGDKNMSPEIKKAALEILGKVQPKTTDLGKQADNNAIIAEKAQKDADGLSIYFWLVWGIVGGAGGLLIAYGALKTALWAKIGGGLLIALSLAMGFKRLFL